MRPTVYGYVRSSRVDPVTAARHGQELARHAETEEWSLANVFIDNGVPGKTPAAARPGLSALLAALERSHAYGVVVPAAYHLSWDERTRQTLERLITDRGAALHVMPQTKARRPQKRRSETGAAT